MIYLVYILHVYYDCSAGVLHAHPLGGQFPYLSSLLKPLLRVHYDGIKMGARYAAILHNKLVTVFKDLKNHVLPSQHKYYIWVYHSVDVVCLIMTTI